MEKDKKDYLAYKNSKGQFVSGNPGGGRPLGSTNFRAHSKSTAQKRATIDRMWVDMYEENAHTIFKNILDLCVGNNEKALFTFAPYILAKNKEVDNDKAQNAQGKSVEELQAQLQELTDQIEEKLKEGDKNDN